MGIYWNTTIPLFFFCFFCLLQKVLKDVRMSLQTDTLRLNWGQHQVHVCGNCLLELNWCTDFHRSKISRNLIKCTQIEFLLNPFTIIGHCSGLLVKLTFSWIQCSSSSLYTTQSLGNLCLYIDLLLIVESIWHVLGHIQVNVWALIALMLTCISP